MKSLNFYLLSATLICSFIISCAAPVQEVNGVSRRSVEIKRIVLIPFSSEERYSEEESASYPVVSGKEEFLTNALYDALVSKVKEVDIVPIESANLQLADVKKKNPGLTYKEAAIRAGKDIGADAVLIGNLFVYREREGSELSVVSPASVAFDTQLISTVNGEIIWQDYFTETQKPLLENVGQIGKFVKRKGKWVTADEIAEEGVAQVVDKLNRLLEQK